MKFTNIIKTIVACTFFTPTSQAVNVNLDGYGEAIILPYYTVNNGLNTLITVNNSTDQVKAVKLHFREGKEGKSVLSFNLFLAPQDIWVAGLVPAISIIPDHTGESTVKLLFNDETCVPFLNSSAVEFLPYEIDTETDDSDLKRATEGYIEIVEMGELNPSFGLGEAATFESNGIPRACDDIEQAYNENGIWHESTGDLTDQLLPARGGLSATAGIIDVVQGTWYSYDGLAFENFYPAESIFHTLPDDTRVPSLNQSSTTSKIIDNDELVVTEWEHGYQAISALLMKNKVTSFYNTDASLAAKTEVLFTFPTKRFYPENTAPFAENGASQSSGCANFEYVMFNREAASTCNGSNTCSTNQLKSPSPPQSNYQVCNSTDVLQFINANEEPDENPTKILGSSHFESQNVLAFEAGKFDVYFYQSITAPDSVTYSGVPVIALAFEKYANSNAAPGLLAEYGGIYTPNHNTEISSN